MSTMRYSTPTEHPFKISEDEQTYLATLLKAKLQAIPPFHIPSLTLSDILHSTARAFNIPNIPSDIQLSFFLRNRHVINRYGGKPVKDEAKQSLKITRATWFWRLDEARQFQRFHDTMRWNTAMFIALLTLHELDRNSSHQRGVEMSKDIAKQGRRDTPISRGRSTYISAAARRFMTQYLAAVLEHHNTPLLFTARESFINTWKNSAWDVYTGFRGAQKKLLKNLMKRLNKDWEEELDVAEKIMGVEKFQRRVGRFVGCLIPQKRQQNVPAALSGGEVGRSERGGNAYTSDTSPHVSHDSRDETNELLDALRVPFNPQPKDKKEAHQGNQSYQVEDVQEVTDLRTAIDAVQTMRPRDMLPVLMHLFPAD